MSSPAGADRAASRVLRWLAPSCAGALAAPLLAGLVDALRHVDREGDRALDGAIRIAAAAGYSVMVAAPLGFVLALVGRAITAAWRPRALTARLTDDDGGAPRLAGWLGAAIGGLALVAVTTNQVIWLLARATAFRARTLAIVLPVVMILVVVALTLVTGTVGVGLGRALAALERRRRRRGRGPLLTPGRVVAAIALVAVLGFGAAWLAVVRPLVRQLAIDGVGFAVIAVAGLIGVHAAWPYLPRPGRRGLLAAATAIAVVVIAIGGWARTARPTMILALWGGDGFGSFAVDVVLDINAVRDRIPATELAPRRRPGAPHRDLVLLTIDTFRPDRLAAYGGPVATPALGGLAGRGAVFELALAPSNVTRRSIPSMVTGVAPTRIRGRVSGWALRMDPRHITVAERLRAAGYDTVGLFCCEGFWNRKRPTGLERGFTTMIVEHDADKLVAAAGAYLAGRAPGSPPLYLWLHFIELHEWAGGDPDMRPERRRLYDDSLTRLDATVGKLVEVLAALPPERAPIVIVTGDHSEALGDHGAPFHSSDLYNSQIQVPLIVAGPGIAPRRIAEPVSLLDLVPTMLDLAGFEPPAHPLLDGRSLADLVTGARAPDPERGQAFAAMIVDRFVRTGLRTLVRGRWKIIHHTDTGRDELYDLSTDPRELVDRSARDPAKLGELRAALIEQANRDRASPFPR